MNLKSNIFFEFLSLREDIRNNFFLDLFVKHYKKSFFNDFLAAELHKAKYE